jgi:hypothetical protein
MSKEQKLLDKIKKLLALGNDLSTTQQEAQSALRKANQLLLQHNLTLTDVEVSSIQSDIVETDKSKLAFGSIREEGQWEANLLNVLCYYNLCHSIKHVTTYSSKGSLSIIGKKHNVEIVTYLFDVARQMFRSLSKQEYNKHRKQVLEQFTPEGLSERDCLKQKHLGYRMPWIRSYLKGCVFGLSAKLKLEKKSVEKDISGDKYAVMCTNTSVAIENFKKQQYSNLKKGRVVGKIKNDHGAYSKGLIAGRNSNLSKAISSRETTAKQLS